MTVPLPAAAPRRLKELTPSAVAACLAADPRLLVPVGTCEAHGPHLPFGTDSIIADRLADDLSALTGVLRAPTVEYGVNAPAVRTPPGSVTVRKKTLHRLLNDLIAAWEQCGVDEVVLLTAHRHDPHQEALATVIPARARVRVVDVFAIGLADLLDGQLEPMHGDEVDTSLLLHLAPALVRPADAADYMVERETLRRVRQGRRPRPAGGDGILGRPSLASAEKGARIYERLVTRIAARVLGVGGAAAPPEMGA